jgi:hypothetical protein
MDIDNAQKAAILAEQRKKASELLFDLRGEREEGQKKAYSDTSFYVYFHGRSAMHGSEIAQAVGIPREDIGVMVGSLLATAVERRLKEIEDELEKLQVRFERITRRR